jgi:hypothetical protein
MSSNDFALILLIVCLGLGVAHILEPRRNPAPLAHASAARYDGPGRMRAPVMHTHSPRRPTMDEIDTREARKRERLVHLALIAPSPEMIRQVMALNDEERGDAAVTTPAPTDEVYATPPNL